MKLPRPKKLLTKRILLETENEILLVECNLIDLISGQDVRKACKIIWSIPKREASSPEFRKLLSVKLLKRPKTRK